MSATLFAYRLDDTWTYILECRAVEPDVNPKLGPITPRLEFVSQEINVILVIVYENKVSFDLKPRDRAASS